MSIKKASSSVTKSSTPAKRTAPPKPAPKPSQSKATQSSRETSSPSRETSSPSRESSSTAASRRTDEVKISDEARETRSSRRDNETSRAADEQNRAEDVNKPGETGSTGETTEVNDNKPADEVGEDTTPKPEAEDGTGLREELDEIKDLLAGLTENFRNGAAEEAAAAPSGGAPSGGSPSEGGGESQPAEAPTPVNPMQNANQAQMNGGIDAQLTQLATQVIMLSATGQGGGTGMPGMGAPGMNGFGQGAPQVGMPGMNNFGMGNQAFQGMGNQAFQGFGNGFPAGANPLMGAGGMSPADALRNKLGAVYQQSGGMNNPGIRPETHQLVQVALGGGGAAGLNLGVFPGMGGMGPGVNAQMGVNPQFGAAFGPQGFGMASGF